MLQSLTNLYIYTQQRIDRIGYINEVERVAEENRDAMNHALVFVVLDEMAKQGRIDYLNNANRDTFVYDIDINHCVELSSRIRSDGIIKRGGNNIIKALLKSDTYKANEMDEKCGAVLFSHCYPNHCLEFKRIGESCALWPEGIKPRPS